MGDLTLIMFVSLLAFVIISKISGRIPKTGRCIDANGETIEAVIVNENRIAEKAVTMKLMDSDGNRYRVKLKDSEAKMWIKGDTVNIKFSEDKKNYRVLFHDYFRNNEERMRENAIKKIEKINPNLFAGRLTECKKENLEAFSNSEVESLTLFVFLTYMRRITSYCVLSAIMTAFFLGWYNIFMPPLKQLILPIVLLAISYFVLYTTVMSCKRILKKYAT